MDTLTSELCSTNSEDSNLEAAPPIIDLMTPTSDIKSVDDHRVPVISPPHMLVPVPSVTKSTAPMIENVSLPSDVPPPSKTSQEPPPVITIEDTFGGSGDKSDKATASYKTSQQVYIMYMQSFNVIAIFYNFCEN